MEMGSGFFGLDLVFDGHVFEFAGFKDITALLAFNKFSVVVAGHYPDTRVPAGLIHNGVVRGNTLAMRGIWIEFILRTKLRYTNWRYFMPVLRVVK